MADNTFLINMGGRITLRRKEFVKEMDNMCNLSELVWNEGHTEGRIDAYLDAIKRMQENLMLTAEQAMDILGIPAEERSIYLNR